MTANTTYQGWKNYETWCVSSWIDNEEGTYNHWREVAEEAWEEAEHGGNRFIEDRTGRAQTIIAEKLKREFDCEAELPELPGFYADLLNAALGEVDWFEIAEHLLERVKE